jgi:hypothetical protein
MSTLHERDAMICRACGKEERASEGYPCSACGTFICVICTMKGVTTCRACGGGAAVPLPGAPPAAGA